MPRDPEELIREIIDNAPEMQLEGVIEPEGVTLEDFHAFMPTHTYIFAPNRAMWPASSVNARIKPVPVLNPDGSRKVDDNGKPAMIPASAWLDQHQPVEQMTWAPGLPMIVPGRLLLDGGWVERGGVSCFNLYLAGPAETGDAAAAATWVEHVKMVYAEDAEHIISWLAHRVQRPDEKINHALVLGGEQGIGKDTLLHPVRWAIGAWNFQEASPAQVLGRFNGFLKSVILRISEARDLGDSDRFKFYDHMKTYTAAPPDVLRIDEKHLREYAVLNCCGVIITTNYKVDGVYLPPDDRRHYVAWSYLTKEDDRFQDGYWSRLWAYYADGGCQAVATYLRQRDLSGFDPKAPPEKTEAFWEIANANRAPEEGEMADAVDALGNPNALWLDELQQVAGYEFAEWLRDRRNRRIIPYRLEKCGYVPVRNPDANDGLWKVGARRVIYATRELNPREQVEAVRKKVRESPPMRSDGYDV